MADATLYYVGMGVPEDELVPEQCTVLRTTGDAPRHYWMLRICVQRADNGKRETRAIPINVNGPPSGPPPDPKTGWATWGLNRVEGRAGIWQVTPSINMLEERYEPGGYERGDKPVLVEIWHKTPEIVGVPDGESWMLEPP